MTDNAALDRRVNATSPSPNPNTPGTGSATTSILDWITALSGAATVLGVVVAVAATVAVYRQLRSQAQSQTLTAVLATNGLWIRVTKAQQEVELSEATVNAIVAAYDSLGLNIASVLKGAPPGPFRGRVPYVLGALLPVGEQDADAAPTDDKAYNLRLVHRTIALGYVLGRLKSSEESDDPTSIAQNVRQLESAVEAWVNRINEVAELYGEGLIDRRLYIGKRHVTVSQQSFFAEPYIMWRNTNFSGRWGMRLAALGQEARHYHWKHPLQDRPVSARVDPDGYGPQPGYEGFCVRVGLMFGAGHSQDALDVAERSVRHDLGRAFDGAERVHQNRLLARLPIRASMLVRADHGRLTWEDLASDPTTARQAIIEAQRKAEIHG